MLDQTETPTAPIPVPEDVGSIEGTADGWRWQCADCGESPDDLAGTFLTAWDGLRLHLEYEHGRRPQADATADCRCGRGQVVVLIGMTACCGHCAREHYDRQSSKPTSLCRDEDCPECGWPETYAEVDLSAETPGADAIGCRKCGWRVEASEVTA